MGHQVKQEEEIRTTRLNQSFVLLLQTIDDAGDSPQSKEFYAPDEGTDASESVDTQEDDKGPKNSDVEVEPLLPALHGHHGLAHGDVTMTHVIIGLKTPQHVEDDEQDGKDDLKCILDDIQIVEETGTTKSSTDFFSLSFPDNLLLVQCSTSKVLSNIRIFTKKSFLYHRLVKSLQLLAQSGEYDPDFLNSNQ